jgi:hypothetical protein
VAIRGRRRRLQCWRHSAGGRLRGARGVRVRWGWVQGPALPSRCPFRGLGKRQAAQVVRSLGCLAARGKECPLVSLQELNPGADIARVPDVTVKAEFRAQERGTQFRNQFLGCVIA